MEVTVDRERKQTTWWFLRLLRWGTGRQQARPDLTTEGMCEVVATIATERFPAELVAQDTADCSNAEVVELMRRIADHAGNCPTPSEEEIERAIKTELTEFQRRILYLHKSGWTPSKIAQYCHVGEELARQELKRAYSRLLTTLGPAGETPELVSRVSGAARTKH